MNGPEQRSGYLDPLSKYGVDLSQSELEKYLRFRKLLEISNEPITASMMPPSFYQEMCQLIALVGYYPPLEIEERAWLSRKDTEGKIEMFPVNKNSPEALKATDTWLEVVKAYKGVRKHISYETLLRRRWLNKQLWRRRHFPPGIPN